MGKVRQPKEALFLIPLAPPFGSSGQVVAVPGREPSEVAGREGDKYACKLEHNARSVVT